MTTQNETPRGALSVSPNQTEFTPQQIMAFGLEEAGQADRLRFLHIVQKTGLDPVMKQIYVIGRWNKNQRRTVFTAQTSIDGYRLIAHRTNAFGGMETTHTPVVNDPTRPYSATVTVWRFTQGQRVPFTATAFFAEYAADSPFWKKMPWRMIEKCAEALALRMAFPDELSGVYTEDEMAQADTPAPQVQAEPVKVETPAPVTEIHNSSVKTRMVNILTEAGNPDPQGKAKELWEEAGLSLDRDLVLTRDVANAMVEAALATQWETEGPETDTPAEGDPVPVADPDPVNAPAQGYDGDPLSGWDASGLTNPDPVSQSQGDPVPAQAFQQTGEPITEKQMRFLGVVCSKLNLSDEQLYERAGALTGRVITSRSELTKKEASDLIDQLNPNPKGGQR